MYSPIVFIGIIFLAYTVIGPLIFLNFDMKIFPKYFMRQFYEPAWQGSFLSLLFIYIGYSLKNKKEKIINTYIPKYNKMFIVAFIINVVGITLYFISNPSRFISQLNPFSGIRFLDDADLGGFVNYLKTAINFLIVGNALMLLSMKKISVYNAKFWTFLFFFVLTFSIYSTLGFRYRLLLLFVTLFVSYYLKKKQRPSILILVVLIPVFINIMGVLGVIRKHGSGLKLNRLKQKSENNFFIEAFRETNIFPISGAVMKAVPDKVDFVYTDIFINTIILPIPRKFLPNKNTDSYIRKPIRQYKELTKIEADKWAAMLFFAEWYIAFGWYGLIGISLFLGFVYRRIWEWTKINLNNGYIIVIYASSLSFLYFLITRGYLPGAVTIFMFSVFPSSIARFFGRLRLNNKFDEKN